MVLEFKTMLGYSRFIQFLSFNMFLVFSQPKYKSTFCLPNLGDAAFTKIFINARAIMTVNLIFEVGERAYVV